jgi:hypothetical protein
MLAASEIVNFAGGESTTGVWLCGDRASRRFDERQCPVVA